MVSSSNHLILVGYRGSGKSTLAQNLSKSMSMPFIDTDKAIEAHHQRQIAEIFREDGESRFREFEKERLHHILTTSAEAHIIATGGGIILDSGNRLLLKAHGFVVYLYASLDILYSRITHQNNRPALTKLALKDEILEILTQRQDFYKEVATMEIDTGKENLSSLTQRISTEYFNWKAKG